MGHRTVSIVLASAFFQPLAAAQTPEGGDSQIQPPRQSAIADSSSPSTTREPLIMSPGQYVLPGPVSPAYWSPHIRPFPDHSGLRRSAGLPRRNLNHRFGPFGAYPSCNNYGWPGGYGYGDAQAAYNQGRYDADREYLWYIAAQRAGRLINQHAEKFDAGVRLFREGRYEEALRNLLGAAEADQSRAAPRLHAGHTMFALGRYAPAMEMIVRAFELSPGLPYKTYDIREEYGDSGDFERQWVRLKGFVAQHPDDAAAMTLLAYVEYYTKGPAAAHHILLRARRLDPDSYFLPKLIAVSSAAGDSTDAAPSEETKSDGRRSPPGSAKTLRVASGNPP